LKRWGVEYRGIRSKRYTYVRKLTGPRLLFDNQTDPFQQNNLVGNSKFSKLEASLKKALKQRLLETKDEFLPGETYIKNGDMSWMKMGRYRIRSKI